MATIRVVPMSRASWTPTVQGSRRGYGLTAAEAADYRSGSQPTFLDLRQENETAMDSRRAAVRKFQTVASTRGKYPSADIDGIWGPKTEAAWMALIPRGDGVTTTRMLDELAALTPLEGTPYNPDMLKPLWVRYGIAISRDLWLESKGLISLVDSGWTDHVEAGEVEGEVDEGGAAAGDDTDNVTDAGVTDVTGEEEEPPAPPTTSTKRPWVVPLVVALAVTAVVGGVGWYYLSRRRGGMMLPRRAGAMA